MARIRPAVALLPLLTALPSACAADPPGASLGRLDSPELYSAFNRADVPAHESVVEAPIERVAALVPGVYRALGLPAQRIEYAPDPLFTTPDLRIQGRLYEGEPNSDYIDCGETGPGGERANLYEVEFVAMTRLRSGSGGGTLVETLVNGLARRPGVTRDSAVRCTGTGKLEQQIADLLRARTSRGGG